MNKKPLLEELQEPSSAPAGAAIWYVKRKDNRGKVQSTIAHTAYEAYEKVCSKLVASPDGAPAFSQVEIEQGDEIRADYKKKLRSEPLKTKTSKPAKRRRQTRKR